MAAEIPGPHASFDANMDAHHHYRIEFFGRCPQCRPAKARPHRPRRSP